MSYTCFWRNSAHQPHRACWKHTGYFAPCAHVVRATARARRRL